jgi:cytochrome P450
MTTIETVHSTKDFDITGFGTPAGAYPFYDRIREDEPVFWSERLQRWIITRYDDVFSAYRDADTYSSKTFGARGGGTVLEEPAQNRVMRTFLEQILLLDNPEHTRLRKLVSYAFIPKHVAMMHEYIGRTVRQMLDRLKGEQDFDFVTSFAGPLPLQVIAELVGIDVGDRDRYREWSDALAFVTEPNQPREELSAAFRRADEMRDFLHTLVEERRHNTGDDLVSRMIGVEDSGDRLTTDEIVAMTMLLTAAGHETTTGLLVNLLQLVLSDHEATARAAHDPMFRKTAIEETLRWEPPLQFSTRIVTADIEVQGVKISEGSAVALSVAAANRDPRKFAEPNRFDPTRAENPHLTFGQGVHFCLGAHLARMEADVVLETLARDYATLAPGDEVVRKVSPLFRGFVSARARWN